jgi:hypothetical protein
LKLGKEISLFIVTSSRPDHPFGLLVRVLDYRSRGMGLDSGSCKIFWEVVGTLSLVRITEELLERKSCGCGFENRD